MPLSVMRDACRPSASASTRIASSGSLAQQLGLGDGREAQPVAGVGGVGNQLAQEDLPVAVQGVDHELQQLADFGLKAEGFAASPATGDIGVVAMLGGLSGASLAGARAAILGMARNFQAPRAAEARRRSGVRAGEVQERLSDSSVAGSRRQRRP